LLSGGIDRKKRLIKIAVNCFIKRGEIMKRKLFLSLMIAGLVVLLPACAAGVSSDPATPINSITISEDLTTIDLCQAIPKDDIETVMGVQLVETPSRYTLRNTEGTSGCFYEGPTDSDRERHFGYVILTPLEAYDNQKLNQNVDVTGIGDAAYFNKGGDARQLWVKLNDKVAFVIGFGDVAKEGGAKALAKLIVAAIQ